MWRKSKWNKTFYQVLLKKPDLKSSFMETDMSLQEKLCSQLSENNPNFPRKKVSKCQNVECVFENKHDLDL